MVKRQKERARQERKKLKLERRAKRNAERRQRPASAADDHDISGIVAGSQPRGEPND